jgi:stage II sporulation protein D
MKKIIGALCALAVFLCAGTLVFAASEDVPGFVRVGIGQYGCSLYYVTFPEGFAVYEYGGGEISLIESYPDVTRVELVCDAGYINVYDEFGEELFISYGDTSQYFVGSTDMENGTFTEGGRNWRGGLMLHRCGLGYSYINVLSLEKYLYGVLPKEMSASYPSEALKAQAVCARSYAARMVLSGGKHSAQGYDVCTSQDCQVYGGMGCESPRCSSAVSETTGMLVYYNGAPVSCYYSANNGGFIESGLEIWGGASGYLQAKKDDFNPADNWEVTYTDEKLRSLLRTAGFNVGNIQKVQVTKRSSGGSVLELVVTGDAGTATIGRDRIRSVLGSNSVRSLKFDIVDNGYETVTKTVREPVEKESTIVLDQYYVLARTGEVRVLNLNEVVANSLSDNLVIKKAETVTVEKTVQEKSGYDGIRISGKGYGHGVGMSQTGAREMASRGYGFADILQYYFTDVTVQ